jgi:hypothetical protein
MGERYASPCAIYLTILFCCEKMIKRVRSKMKPKEIVLWHDNNIVINIENCEIYIKEDQTDSVIPYRWVELETGHRFAELEGWHYRIRDNDTWITGWENYYED